MPEEWRRDKGKTDLDEEVLLDCHDDLYGVERVESQVLGERGVERELRTTSQSPKDDERLKGGIR